MRDAPSPNHDERPGGVPIDTLVLHYTGMQTGQAAIDRLRDPAARVSSHYVVEEDGTVWKLVPEERRAWHAGISSWRGQSWLNNRSVGIEIVNPGHEWGYRDFPPVQMAAVRDLCRGIGGRHPIPARNVVGHSDVAPDRKDDPGERFDWRWLAAEGVGLWPGADPAPVADDEVAAALTAIGYPIPELATTLRAFQRHWRPESVTGVADAGTRARIAAVLAASVAYGPGGRAHDPRARRLDGRCSPHRRMRWVEESPGSTEIRCRLTAGGGDPRDSATENKPPAFISGCGGQG